MRVETRALTRRYVCAHCGYRYPAAELGFEPGRRYPMCLDEWRCFANVQRQRRDREAVR